MSSLYVSSLKNSRFSLPGRNNAFEPSTKRSWYSWCSHSFAKCLWCAFLFAIAFANIVAHVLFLSTVTVWFLPHTGRKQFWSSWYVIMPTFIVTSFGRSSRLDFLVATGRKVDHLCYYFRNLNSLNETVRRLFSWLETTLELFALIEASFLPPLSFHADVEVGVFSWLFCTWLRKFTNCLPHFVQKLVSALSKAFVPQWTQQIQVWPRAAEDIVHTESRPQVKWPEEALPYSLLRVYIREFVFQILLFVFRVMFCVWIIICVLVTCLRLQYFLFSFNVMFCAWDITFCD